MNKGNKNGRMDVVVVMPSLSSRRADCDPQAA